MTIERIKSLFPGLELPDEDWQELKELTQHEYRDFPVAKGQVRFGLLVGIVGELQATVERLIQYAPAEVEKVASAIYHRSLEKTEFALRGVEP